MRPLMVVLLVLGLGAAQQPLDGPAAGFVGAVSERMGLVAGNCRASSLAPHRRDRAVCLTTDKNYAAFAPEWDRWAGEYLGRYGGQPLVDWVPVEDRVSAYLTMYRFGGRALTVWHTRQAAGRYEVIVAISLEAASR